MASTANIKVRADGNIHVLSVSERDVRLLDGDYFFPNGWGYRQLFGLDFIRGLKPKETPIITHRRASFVLRLKTLLSQLEEQRDLVSFDYSYSFGDESKQRHSGAMSGFRLAEGYGHISVRPAGYCTLKVSDEATGKLSTIIDMRVRREVLTLDRGKLKSHRRKAEVGWFEQLPPLIHFLSNCSGDIAEIVND
jgi:hypothetical protein